MNILDIIAKKRDKKILTKEEIEYFIDSYVKEEITDYQASALIMAIYINGMTDEEIKDFTLAMAYSGEVLDLSMFGENVVDKHSTGGVGDKITLILMPIIASLGIPVAKMSGRGLGFTGGTIDKLESIPGYETNQSIDKFIKNVENIGISLSCATLNLAPADKKIYALRDTISCVDNIPLIASSIMSKKIAAGANKIVLEVTVGSGAFMKTLERAKELANMMIRIGNLAGKETICVLTNMNEPIGYSIGNTLEVIEVVEALKGNMEDDVRDIVLELGSQMIKVFGNGEDIKINKKKILQNINNGKAYNKFIELVSNQGGDIQFIQNTEKLKLAKYKIPVCSEREGYVNSINVEKLGKISCYLGAGRLKKEDKIDNEVGIIVKKKIGDKINLNENFAYVYANNLNLGNKAVEQVKECYNITKEKTEKLKCILGIIK